MVNFNDRGFISTEDSRFFLNVLERILLLLEFFNDSLVFSFKICPQAFEAHACFQILENPSKFHPENYPKIISFIQDPAA
jgi:hypothetical protein